jgi:hypothetical protein
MKWKDDPLVCNGKKSTVWDLKPKEDFSQIEEVIILCSEDPLYNLYHCVKTKDQVDRANPIKPFPRRDYIEYFVRHVYPVEDLIVIPKSRRMTMSWMVIALMEWEWWRGLAFTGFIQSKKENDAGELVDRCEFIYNQRPDWMKYPGDDITTTKQPPMLKNLPKESWIWGIPQGDDQLRQYTSAMILFDEVAFQDRFRQAWTAAKPTLDGGGKAIVVSTPNGPNFFHSMCFDQFND